MLTVSNIDGYMMRFGTKALWVSTASICYNPGMKEKHVGQFAIYGGITATALEWLALLFFYLREPQFFTGQHALSYFATLPETRIVFSLCYLGAAVSFWLFASYHLKNFYRTPVRVFALSMLAFAGLALYPYEPSSTISAVIHTIFAQSSFGLFLLGMVLMAWHSDDARFKVVTYVAIALSAILLIAYLFQPDTSRLLLVFEVGAWLMFQLWTIWISRHAYLKAQRP